MPVAAEPACLKRRLRDAVEANLVANGVGAMTEQVLDGVRHVVRHDHRRADEVRARDGDHVREDSARRDDVDADAVIVHLVSEGLGEAVQRVLAGDVGALVGVALMGDDRADVHDLRRLRGAEERERLTHEDERRANVRRHDGIKLVRGDVLEWACLDDGRVVHEDVEATLFLERFDEGEDGSLILEIAGVDESAGVEARPSRCLIAGLRRLDQARLGAAHDRDGAAECRQPPGDRGANARARSRDQRPLALDARPHTIPFRLGSAWFSRVYAG